MTARVEYGDDLSKPATERSPRPNAFIQWKGTTVCLDFYCLCGEQGHVDASFAYYVSCGACGATYEMPVVVPVRPLGAGEEAAGVPVVAG